MARLLRPHPDSIGPAGIRVEAEASRTGPRALSLRYRLAGPPGALRIPARAPPERADGLWKHTCFEAFIGGLDGDDYCELNLAPSTRWAAYRFDAWRRGMAPADIPAPRIEVLSAEDGVALEAELDLGAVGDLPAAGAWRLGLSAVVEDAEGRISYFALAHPPGKPDFHHPDGFALKLEAPQRP